ncbi:SAM dependent methyltransferase protein [Rutstroemia sp. NJR-2017a WRK4]|nr:SAM dependent methyltransferase protein [Rutstroemia sp. NJR-2017a WRK4]
MTTPENHERQEELSARGSSRSYSSEEDEAGDTYSIDSSAMAFRVENGRRYQAYREGAYWAPNDELQNEHLDISHQRFLSMLSGRLFLAPIPDNIERVLDLGTGTGIWAIDFADLYPNASVLGTDLSPIQPENDMTEEWTYPTSHFDFIHIRSLFGSIPDWPKVYEQAFKHLKPGGFIEHIEPSLYLRSDDGTLAPDNPLNRFADLFNQAGERTGQSMDLCPTMASDMTTAGFINLREETFKTPMGEWCRDPKLRELGRWNLLQFDVGLEGFAVQLLTKVMGVNTRHLKLMDVIDDSTGGASLLHSANVRAAARDPSTHAYYPHRVVYAQKPLATPRTSPGRTT